MTLRLDPAEQTAMFPFSFTVLTAASADEEYDRDFVPSINAYPVCCMPAQVQYTSNFGVRTMRLDSTPLERN